MGANGAGLRKVVYTTLAVLVEIAVRRPLTRPDLSQF
jgi:hypothetical protein